LRDTDAQLQQKFEWIVKTRPAVQHLRVSLDDHIMVEEVFRSICPEARLACAGWPQGRALHGST
jgi:hypothetical protein